MESGIFLRHERARGEHMSSRAPRRRRTEAIMDQSPIGELAAGHVMIERWPTERLLLVLVGLASLAIWILLAVSIIGLAYVVAIAMLLFLTHLVFVAHVRGSGVRLGPDQFPDLHRRVEELSTRLGMRRSPEAYIIQAGGALNALATTFLRSEIVVLFSDLLDACGESESARDMIIGHEIGHLRAGHLKWKWFLLPGMLVPFLGTAYSRAREYTCDRYGATLCGDRGGALLGMSILAAGGAHGRKVNTGAFARQQESLNTGWMTVGAWLSTHPPISQRISAIEPDLAVGLPLQVRGRLRALIILVVAVTIPMLGAAFFAKHFLPIIRNAMTAAEGGWVPEPAGPPVVEDVEGARAETLSSMEIMAGAIERYRRDNGRLPADTTALYDAWLHANPGKNEPLDAFDGERLGYQVDKAGWWLWSTGPDGRSGTDDDIWYDERGILK